MNPIKVLKLDIERAIDINDLNNLPPNLEILYIPFCVLDVNNFNFNFPPSLKEIYMGHLNYKHKISFDALMPVNIAASTVSVTLSDVDTPAKNIL